jgi:hypothetical protein
MRWNPTTKSYEVWDTQVGGFVPTGKEKKTTEDEDRELGACGYCHSAPCECNGKGGPKSRSSMETPCGYCGEYECICDGFGFYPGTKIAVSLDANARQVHDNEMEKAYALELERKREARRGFTYEEEPHMPQPPRHTPQPPRAPRAPRAPRYGRTQSAGGQPPVTPSSEN